MLIRHRRLIQPISGTQSSADFMTPLTDLPQEAIPFCAPGRTASGQVDGATVPPWPMMQGLGP